MGKILPVPKEFKAGDRFVAIGTLPLCEGCLLKDRCGQYKKGWIYEVKGKVGLVEHDCKIHGKVVMGEVEEVGVSVILPKKVAIEGATVEYVQHVCNKKDCPLWKECTAYKGKRVKIKVKEILEDVKCPLGYSLVRAIGVPLEVVPVERQKFKRGRRGRR